MVRECTKPKSRQAGRRPKLRRSEEGKGHSPNSLAEHESGKLGIEVSSQLLKRRASDEVSNVLDHKRHKPVFKGNAAKGDIGEAEATKSPERLAALYKLKASERFTVRFPAGVRFGNIDQLLGSPLAASLFLYVCTKELSLYGLGYLLGNAMDSLMKTRRPLGAFLNAQRYHPRGRLLENYCYPR